MIYILLIVNFLFSIESQFLLNDLYKQNQWVEYSVTNDNKIIYESSKNHEAGKYIKVIKKIDYSKLEIFNKIKSIFDYNQIISNKNVNTRLILQDKDTLYAYQKISNSIPFVRDRQYIFKMYQVNDKRLDWYMLDKNHYLLKTYLSDNVHTLTYGAGSWYVDANNLINRTFVDDEVNLPNSFLHKIRISNMTAIFDDIINSLIKEEN